MNWKKDLQLRDLAPTQPIEVMCRVCNYGRNEWPAELLAKYPDWGNFYLDEVEAELRCARRGCTGRVRISLVRLGDTEAFVGGMA